MQKFKQYLSKLKHSFKEQEAQKNYFLEKKDSCEFQSMVFNYLHLVISASFVFVNLVVLESSSSQTQSALMRLGQLSPYLLFTIIQYIVHKYTSDTDENNVLILEKKKVLTQMNLPFVLFFSITDTLILFDIIYNDKERYAYYESIYGIYLGLIFCMGVTVLPYLYRIIGLFTHVILFILLLPDIYTTPLIVVGLIAFPLFCLNENYDRQKSERKFGQLNKLQNLKKCMDVFKEPMLIITKNNLNKLDCQSINMESQKGASSNTGIDTIKEDIVFPFANKSLLNQFGISSLDIELNTANFQNDVINGMEILQLVEEEKLNKSFKRIQTDVRERKNTNQNKINSMLNLVIDCLEQSEKNDQHSSIRSQRSKIMKKKYSSQSTLGRLCEKTVTNPQTDEYFEIRIDKSQWKGRDSVIVVFYDITQKYKAKKLEEINQMKDQILATVTHDLKNPINGIFSYIEVLSDQVKCIDQQKNKELNNVTENKITVDEINTSLGQMKNITSILYYLVRDIQDMALIKHNKLSLFPQNIDLKKLVQEVTGLFKDEVKKKKIQIRHLYLDELKYYENIMVYTDPLRLKQVIMNFVSNSVKYTNTGFIDVIIQPLKNKQNMFMISVKDTGMGMKDEIKLNLFKAFNSYDQNTGSYGVGLGLCIIENLVNKLGPKQNVQLESEVGKGSTFSFNIYKDLDLSNQNKSFQEEQDENINLQDINIDLIDQNQTQRIKVYSQDDNSEIKQTDEQFHNQSRCIVQLKHSLIEKNQQELQQQTISQINTQRQFLLDNKSQNNVNIKVQQNRNKNNNEIQNINNNNIDSKTQKIKQFLSRFKNILIVDDQVFNLIGLKMVLKKFINNDQNIIEANSGEEALQKQLENSQIDLIFTDNHMGQLTGFQIAEKIKKINPNIKIYLCTAESQQNYDKEEIKNFNGVIEKPFNQDKLYQIIK